CLAPGDTPGVRLQTQFGLCGIDAESRRPVDPGLWRRPQRHIADTTDRDRRLDRLAHTRARRVDLELETQLLADYVRDGIGGRERQHHDRNRVTAQVIAFLAAEKRE